MGNRAVLVTNDTTKENADKKIGIYLHWCGGEDTVKEFLSIAKEKGIRNPNYDSQYGWARLCQIIADAFTESDLQSPYETARNNAYSNSIGIGIVNQLDCHNYDNGVYYIDENLEIAKHTSGAELE